jgi:hypothetical protein
VSSPPLGDRLKATMEDMNGLWRVLISDKAHLDTFVPGRDDDAANDSHGRIAIRTWFAAIEGLTNGVLWALHQAEEERVKDMGQARRFSDAELLAMTGKGCKVDADGGTKAQQHISLLSKVRLLFTFLEKLGVSSWRVDYGKHLEGTCWGDLKRAVTVRNRLTHPRRPSCLHLSDEDFNSCRNGYMWWDKNMARFLHREQFGL